MKSLHQKKKLKIILAGNNRAAINVLDFLLTQKIALVKHMVVVPYRKKVHSWHDSLYDFAKSKKLKLVFHPRDINHPSFIAKIKKFAPDYIISVYYDQIFSKELINIPKYGCINIHPSLLPHYRGVSPLIWAIINGEKETGVTIHYINEEIDKGDIISQERIKISPSDTGYTLHLKAADKIKTMFIKLFRKLIENPKPKGRKQRGIGSYYSKKSPQKNLINWSDSATNIHNIVRALTKPLPGAYTYFNYRKCYIWQTKLFNTKIPISSKINPGTLYFFPHKRKLLVMTNKNFLEIKKISYNNKEYSGLEFYQQIVKKSNQNFFTSKNVRP